MHELGIFFSILVSGFSLILFVVSIVSFYRLKATKLFFVGLGFFVFFIKGLLMVFNVFSQDLLGIIIDFVIVVCLYVSTIKK